MSQSEGLFFLLVVTQHISWYSAHLYHAFTRLPTISCAVCLFTVTEIVRLIEKLEIGIKIMLWLPSAFYPVNQMIDEARLVFMCDRYRLHVLWSIYVYAESRLVLNQAYHRHFYNISMESAIHFQDRSSIPRRPTRIAFYSTIVVALVSDGLYLNRHHRNCRLRHSDRVYWIERRKIEIKG